MKRRDLFRRSAAVPAALAVTAVGLTGAATTLPSASRIDFTAAATAVDYGIVSRASAMEMFGFLAEDERRYMIEWPLGEVKLDEGAIIRVLATRNLSNI